MSRWSTLGKLVGAIALLTLLSGLTQMVRPTLVLAVVGGDSAPGAAHFFGTVGMFMLLFGGLTLHGLLHNSALVMLWAGLQKVGAVVAVALGVCHDIFSSVALLVAGFDLLSAVLILSYWRVLARRPT